MLTPLNTKTGWGNDKNIEKGRAWRGINGCVGSASASVLDERRTRCRQDQTFEHDANGHSVALSKHSRQFPAGL